MKIALLVVGAIVCLAVLFAAWRYYATIRGQQQLRDALSSQTDPIIQRVKSGASFPEEIAALAANPVVRNTLYLRLKELGRTDLFPPTQATVEKHAESDLVVWLMHPNELGAAPMEIILAKTIAREEGGKKYFFCVFRFRDSDRWLAGVAGPYWEGEIYQGPAPGVFSRFEAFDSNSPEGHFEIVEKQFLGK